MISIGAARAFSDNWQLVLALASAAIYVTGYVRAMLFIRTLGTKITPTEIYAPSSLFVSGLGTILAATAFPVLILLLSALTGRFAFSLLSLAGGLAYLGLLAATMFGLPGIARMNISGFRFLPEVSVLQRKRYLWFRIAAAIVLANLVYLPLSFPGEAGAALYAAIYWISLLAWIGLLVSQQRLIGADITAGISPGNFSQDPAMRGALITTGRIGPLGQQQPEFGEGAFSTYGLLLNRRGGAYYFYPGVGAQEQVEIEGFADAQIVIVPESRVVVFVHIPGVWL